MAKRCPHCGYVIEDEERLFCPKCGELADKKASDEKKLINELDKTLVEYQKSQSGNPTQKSNQSMQRSNTASHRRSDDYDDEPISKLKKTQPKKSGGSSTVIVIIVIVIIIIVLAKLFL